MINLIFLLFLVKLSSLPPHVIRTTLDLLITKILVDQELELIMVFIHSILSLRKYGKILILKLNLQAQLQVLENSRTFYFFHKIKLIPPIIYLAPSELV
jgi:hypothetical protein